MFLKEFWITIKSNDYVIYAVVDCDVCLNTNKEVVTALLRKKAEKLQIKHKINILDVPAHPVQIFRSKAQSK